MTELLALVVVFPLAGGGLALIGKLFRSPRLRRIACVVSVFSLAGVGVVLVLIASAIFAGGTLVYSLGGWAEPYGISLRMDGFAWLSATLVLVLSVPVGIASLSRQKYGPAYFFFLLILIAGMLCVGLTGDLFTMFVAFEIVAIAAYALIAYDRTRAGLVASFKYLILSSVGILFFLFGIFLIYRDLGVLSVSSIRTLLAERPARADSVSMHLAVAALCVGIGVRTAFIPFHTWLPEAHAYAPHPISALLSGALIKVSLFALIRILLSFSGAYLFELLLWIGGFTALFAVILALAQTDAKRLLAYHSVSQMGYVLAAFAAMRGVSMAASISHAVNHGLFKALLFLAVGTAIELSGERNVYKIKPIGRQAPLLSVLFFVGALAISGLPPFNGFASKALVLQTVAGTPVAILLWIAGAATVASFIKLGRVFLPGKAATTGNDTESLEGAGGDLRPGVMVLVAMVLLALCVVATGAFWKPLAETYALLAGMGSGIPVSSLYSSSKLLSTAGTVGTGTVLYLVLSTGLGRRVSGRVKAYAPDVRSVLLLFLAGLLGFAVVAYL